jgi:two-component system sensor histidine kinase RegB
VPLPAERPGVRGFDCVSMWLKFALCGGFVGYLLYGLAALVREREARLRQALRRQVNESHLLYAGSLAAGAAHEIRSPLCTMSVLVNDLLREPHDGARCASSLRMVSDQIEACRHILAELMSYGQGVVEADARLEPVDRFLQGVVEKWRLLRPGVELICRPHGPLPAPSIAAPVALGHAVLNLLNNAADASPQEVELACAWTATEVSLQVLDRGPGIPPELQAILGEKPASTKREKGKGIGLLLARSAVERAGGTLTLGDRPDGGACAQIVVPASAVEPAQDAAPAFGAHLYAERV